MATLSKTLSVMERDFGFHLGRAGAIARNLREADLLPSGAPGTSPQLDESDFVSLLIALAADTTLHKAAEAVRTYGTLTPGGTDLTGAPDRIPTAREALEVLVEIALRGDDSQLRKAKVDFCSTWPEITVSYDFGTTERFQPVGTTPDKWQNRKARKSTTISGAAFSDAARAIFGGGR